MNITYNCIICEKQTTKKIASTAKHTPKFCSLGCKSEFQRRKKPVTKEWLEQKYIVEKLSAVDIAEIVHRDPKSVWNWLKDLGIPTRPRGENTKTDKRCRFWEDPTKQAPFKGKHHNEETKAILRKLRSGPQPHLRGSVHHLYGKRGEETPTWKGGITPERNAFYDSDEWKEAVKAIWKRDNATCQKCQLRFKHKETKFNIHHIVSFAKKELRAEPTNLVLLCNRCHRWVHSNQNINKEYIIECDIPKKKTGPKPKNKEENTNE
jgi:HNH endonuclease/NUMOD3 motif